MQRARGGDVGLFTTFCPLIGDNATGAECFAASIEISAREKHVALRF